MHGIVSAMDLLTVHSIIGQLLPVGKAFLHLLWELTVTVSMV